MASNNLMRTTVGSAMEIDGRGETSSHEEWHAGSRDLDSAAFIITGGGVASQPVDLQAHADSGSSVPDSNFNSAATPGAFGPAAPEHNKHATLAQPEEEEEMATGCGGHISASGGGRPWKDGASEDDPSARAVGTHELIMDHAAVGFGREHHFRERHYVFQNMPEFLKYGEHVRPLKTLPGGTDPWDWTLTLYAKGDRKVYVWYQRDADDGSRDFSGHFPEYAEAHGWKKNESGHTFSIRGQDPAAKNKTIVLDLEIWHKVLKVKEGKATEKITLKGFFRGGAVVKPCGIITKVSGGGTTWNDPVQFALDTKPVSSEAGTFVKLPNRLANAWYYAPQHRPPQPQPHNGSWAMQIHYKPPVKIFLIVWSLSPPRLNDEDFNGGVNKAIEGNGWESEPSRGFHLSDRNTSLMQVHSKVFKHGHSITIDGLSGPMLGGVAAASCGLSGVCDE